MGTNYLYGTVLTGEAVAANNRGDNIGNTTTLQKVFHQDDLHSSVSAEAIRFAIRYRFQLELQATQVNRKYNPDTGKVIYTDDKWTDWSPSGDVFADDDVMGFMNAAAAKKEAEEEDADAQLPGEDTTASKSSKKKPKGKAYKRTSPLSVGRAVSLRPYRGELSFNCTVRKEDAKGNVSGLSLYNAEMHTTEYQYSFGLNLNDVINKANIGHLIDAVVDPPPVAGNHSRFAYDFSPSSVVLRVSNAHSSKIQNCFEHDEESRSYTVERLIHRVESGDVPASELIIGGELAATAEGAKLESLGVRVFSGVKAAANEARKRIAEFGKDFAVVKPKEA